MPQVRVFGLPTIPDHDFWGGLSHAGLLRGVQFHVPPGEGFILFFRRANESRRRAFIARGGPRCAVTVSKVFGEPMSSPPPRPGYVA